MLLWFVVMFWAVGPCVAKTQDDPQDFAIILRPSSNRVPFARPRHPQNNTIMLHHQHTFRCVLSLLLLVPSLVNPLSLLKTLRQERLQQQMQQHQRFQQHFQQRFQQRFHLAESEAGSEAPGFQEPLNLGRYPGQPKMQEDGTEGNHAYYSGNYNPAPDSWGDHNENTAREKSMHGSDYWKQNQYYDYFKKVWGNAPLLDSNFRLWMKGYFKSFKVPNQARSYQQTKALPAFLHYYGKTYDPLLDPPFQNEFDLFGAKGEGAGGESGGETAKPIDGDKIKDDCTRSPFKDALGYKRPCGVNEILAKSWTQEKNQLPLNNVLGKNTWWEGNHGGAGSQRGSAYYTYQKLPDSPSEVGESPWIGLDNRWSSGGEMGSETERPANIPPPPKPANEIPMFQLGEKKKESEEESQPEG